MRSLEHTAKTMSRVSQSCRRIAVAVDGENSRGKVQNVRADSSAAPCDITTRQATKVQLFGKSAFVKSSAICWLCRMLCNGM